MSEQALSLHPSPDPTGLHFHLFKELPFELRRAIWKLCRPHRIVDLDITPCQDDLDTGCTGVARTSLLNSNQPIIARVCRESRAVAIEGYDQSLVTRPAAPESQDFTRFRNHYWFNPTTDILHLNWTPMLEYNFDSNSGNPIPELLHMSAQSVGASITADLLYPFSDVGVVPNYPAFLPQDNANFEMLEGRNIYLVILEMVVIHARMRDTLESSLLDGWGRSELYFALEDEEPKRFFRKAVQDRTLYKKVERWEYELKVYWLRFKCEQAVCNGVARREDFNSIWCNTANGYTNEAGANWSGLFDANHAFVKKVLKDMPKFSPAIMFRLCEKKCYEG